MKVGIDHHPARTRHPGVGRYSRELVRALVRLPERPDLVLTDVGRARRAIGEPELGLPRAADSKVAVVRSRMGRLLFRALRRSADGLAGGVDVYHRMLPDWPPVSRAREVLAVAELFEPGSERDRALRAALARADALVFSAQTAERLAERYGLAPERVHRVPVGCDHWLRDLPAAPVARSDPPRIVALGAPEPRRRPERLLAALEALRRRGIEATLHLVGPETAATRGFAAALAASPLRGRVIWSPTPDRGIARVLASASALAHLSADEETAVTPLEGLCFGLPVVASRLAPFEEDLGPDARLLAPEEEEDPDALAGALLDAIATRGDEAPRRARAARFTWEADARATVLVYGRVAARGR